MRIAPYTTDFAVNDLTYGSTVGMTARHAVGTVWATVLWEVTWDLIDAHGFSPNLTDARGAAGNLVALSLVTEALRLQPCRPGFVDGRNAILQADALLYGSAHYALLQTAFARRGLGAGAAQGTSEANTDNVASFVVQVGQQDTVPPAVVTGLAAVATGSSTVSLSFFATGDDGASGQAYRYDIRFSRAPIATASDFARATPVPDLPLPQPAGARETIALTDLLPATNYYLAVRAYDEVNNVSPMGTAIVTTRHAVLPSESPIQIDIVQAAISVLEGAEGQADIPIRNVGSSPVAVYASVVGGTEGGTLGFVRSDRSTRRPAVRTPSIAAPETAITAWTPAAPGLDPRDNGYADVALPFDFAFGDDRFDHARVSTDGYIAFSPGSAPASGLRALGSPALPNGIVAPYWADLRPAPGGNVYAGSLPDGRFAIEYDQMTVALYPDEPPVSFRVLLSASGAIAFEYSSTNARASSVLRGVEDSNGVRAYTFQALAADSTLALLIPPRSVLGLTAESLPINPGQTRPFTVVARSTTLEPGLYTGYFSAITTTALGDYRVLILLNVAARPPGGSPESPPGNPPVDPPDPTGDVPSAVTLRAARPNPARGQTAITFGLPAALPARLTVVDARGREVAVLAEGTLDAGWHDAAWLPGAAAPGLYAVRLVAGGEVRTATVVVVR